MEAVKKKDGRRITYEAYGEGPPLVLIHGSPGNAQTWQAIGETLSGRFRIIAPNMRGYGDSDPVEPGSPMETADNAEDMEAVIA